MTIYLRGTHSGPLSIEEMDGNINALRLRRLIIELGTATAAGDVVFQFLTPFDCEFIEDWGNSVVSIKPAAAEYTFTLKKDGLAFGTITLWANGQYGEISITDTSAISVGYPITITAEQPIDHTILVCLTVKEL